MAADPTPAERRAHTVAVIAAFLHRGGTEGPRPSAAMRILMVRDASALLEIAEAHEAGRFDKKTLEAVDALRAKYPHLSLSQLEASLLAIADPKPDQKGLSLDPKPAGKRAAGER